MRYKETEQPFINSIKSGHFRINHAEYASTEPNEKEL
jgi:hypothetical protein